MATDWGEDCPQISRHLLGRDLVLDHGRTVDSGTHDELLSRGGLYRTLYDRQFRTTRPVRQLVTAG